MEVESITEITYTIEASVVTKRERLARSAPLVLDGMLSSVCIYGGATTFFRTATGRHTAVQVPKAIAAIEPIAVLAPVIFPASVETLIRKQQRDRC